LLDKPARCLLPDKPVNSLGEPVDSLGEPVDSKPVSSEEVLLVLPARPEMWAVARMTASALAVSLDFSFEDIEDFRLAVTELCSSCAVDADASALCECRFTVSSDAIEMHCKVSPVVATHQGPPAHRLKAQLELSEHILEAMVDDHEIGPVRAGARTGFLRKERVPAPIN
jgi:anti-sigma regulatory factor (Ser/Thr protein kinase)